MEKQQAIEVHYLFSIFLSAFELSVLQNEDYYTAQIRKEKMELYRAETYKQLQILNLLDVVIVSSDLQTKDQTNENFVFVDLCSFEKTNLFFVLCTEI